MAVHYCCVSHQRSDWRAHRGKCTLPDISNPPAWMLPTTGADVAVFSERDDELRQAVVCGVSETTGAVDVLYEEDTEGEPEDNVPAWRILCPVWWWMRRSKSDCVQIATKMKESGNGMFRAGQKEAALGRYRLAVRVLEDVFGRELPDVAAAQQSTPVDMRELKTSNTVRVRQPNGALRRATVAYVEEDCSSADVVYGTGAEEQGVGGDGTEGEGDGELEDEDNVAPDRIFWLPVPTYVEPLVQDARMVAYACLKNCARCWTAAGAHDKATAALSRAATLLPALPDAYLMQAEVLLAQPASSVRLNEAEKCLCRAREGGASRKDLRALDAKVREARAAGRAQNRELAAQILAHAGVPR